MQHAKRPIGERVCDALGCRSPAAPIGIKTSSIDYPCQRQEDLLLAAVRRYRARWETAIRSIGTGLRADDKLRAYVDAYKRTFRSAKRIRLAAALAADAASLPAAVRCKVLDFYQAHEDWLARVLEQGAWEGSLRVPGDLRSAARSMFAALQTAAAGPRIGDQRAVRDFARTDATTSSSRAGFWNRREAIRAPWNAANR